MQGRTNALRRRLRNLAEFVFVDAPWEVDIHSSKSYALNEAAAQPSAAKPRRGWLVTPVQHAGLTGDTASGTLQLPAQTCTAPQYSQQTHGWERSWKHLCSFIEAHGPFDGMLGFSQGSGMAACVAALLSRGAECGDRTENTHLGAMNGGRRLSFVILCSGYVPAAPQPADLLATAGPILLPSLHVYSALGASRLRRGNPACVSYPGAFLPGMDQPPFHLPETGDGQIPARASRALAACFEPTLARVREHGRGHLIPADAETVACLAEFIKDSMQRTSFSRRVL